MALRHTVREGARRDPHPGVPAAVTSRVTWLTAGGFSGPFEVGRQKMDMRFRTALACALALAVVACQKDRAPAPRTAAVTRGPISEVVSATGEVSALVTVNVGSQVSGTLSRLHVDFKSVVATPRSSRG